MAAGDVTLFNASSEVTSDGSVDMDDDDFYLALIDNTTPPQADDTTPTWSDYSPNEVTGTGYTAGGQIITGSTWIRTADVTVFDGPDITWTQNGAGFDDAYWGILYSNTATAKNAIAFVELDGPLSLIADDVKVQWGATGIFKQIANATLAA